MTTLRRQAVKITEQILIPAYSDNPNTEEAETYAKEQAQKIVDALLELRGFYFLNNEAREKEKKPELELFVGYFGKFLSEKEIKRWLILCEVIGHEEADRLSTWAYNKEIHLVNRGGLLTSMETAAKNWKSDPQKNSIPENTKVEVDQHGIIKSW